MNEILKIAAGIAVNPLESSGVKVNAEPVPTAAETLEHLEQTLDNLDPVPSTAPPVGAIMDAAADAVIAEIAGTPDGDSADDVVAIGDPVPTVPSGTLADIGGENSVDPERDSAGA